MKQPAKQKRLLLLGGIFIVPIMLIFSQCFNNDNKKPADVRGMMYAGSASCIKCHKDIYSNYLHTAHFQTSRTASAASIHGSFAPDSNTVTLNDSIKVVMEKKRKKFYQVSYLNGKVTQQHPFDITFGGIKAETYLYWKNKQVMQLPITYYNAIRSWANSPGYAADNADFSRVIGARCFECHSSYVKELPQQTKSLERKVEIDPNSMLLSIDCERCHGAAINHVNFHTEYPEEKKPKYIVTYQSLSRSQKIDMCGVCHSGNSSVMLRSTFGFKPGDTLANYKEVSFINTINDPAKMDVHGNQVQLLSSSACFVKSKMDCATCHNTHNNERNMTLLYTQRCRTCHKVDNHTYCKMVEKLGEAAIAGKCIDCHMPKKPSLVIAVHNSSNSTLDPYEVRTHRIAVYPEETKKIISWLQAAKAVRQNHKI
jgi:hypothetical protein